MDLSTQYHHYQQQTHDPSSQFQSFDQSTEAYYAFHQYNQYLQQPQQQYPYHTQDYIFSYQQQEPTSVHPPGVPIEHGLGQAHLQNPFYNPHGVSDPPIGQIPYGDGGRRGGRPFGGGGPGHFGSPFRGRGRGRGRGGPSLAPANNPATFVQGESSQGTPAWPPPRMAWCELCRVDCNTREILEQHKNGKRHKKNLQVYEDLQKLNNRLLVEVQNEQIPVAEVKQDIPKLEKAVGSEHKQPPQENVASQAVTEKNKVETGQQKVSEEAQYTEETARKPETDHFEGRGRGFKRKMRGGRGSKRMRTHEGSRRPIEPPKPKQVVPLVCDLCNVKCDSQVVFDSHLTGKKHLLNLKRYQSHQTMLGQAALQALYPALQALYPALQALNTPNPNVSVSFGPQFHHEGNHGSQDLFPHLASLLFSQGQASAPEPGTSSASAQPSVLENPDHQYPNPQHSQFASEPLIPGAAISEAENQQQPISENPEAESAASAGTESDQVVLFETNNHIGELEPNS